LLSTFDRSGCSNGKAIAFRCSSESDLNNVAANVSDVALPFPTAANEAGAAAKAAAPTAEAFKKSRRLIWQSGHARGEGRVFICN
jgi:hypothetical protein